MKLLSGGMAFGCASFVVSLVLAAAADTDEQQLQGKWIVETFEYNGIPVERMKDALREFKDQKYQLMPKNGDLIEGTVKLDPATKPKSIDLEVNGRTLKGIYQIEGDTLKLSYTLTDGERPTEFVSKPDSGTTLIIHKRAK